MKSIDLLPYELRNKDLYILVCELIDRVLDVCSTPVNDRNKIVHPIIEDLLSGYKSIESVNVYYNTMINPIIGTKGVIESLLRLLGDDARIIEWWEGRMANFKFALEYSDEDLPKIEISNLIDLISQLKNERSHLISIRNKSCEGSHIWDYSEWDYDLYDNLPGVEVDGVYICLRRYIREISDLAAYIHTWQMLTWRYKSLSPFLHSIRKWDYFYWDTADYFNLTSIIHSYLDYVEIDISEYFKYRLSMIIESYISKSFYAFFDDIQPKAQKLIYSICQLHDTKYWYGSWSNPQNIGAFQKFTIELSPDIDQFEENEYLQFYINDQEWSINLPK